MDFKQSQKITENNIQQQQEDKVEVWIGISNLKKFNPYEANISSSSEYGKWCFFKSLVLFFDAGKVLVRHCKWQ